MGLPITLADINIKEFVPADIMKVAKRASMSDLSIVNMPFKVTPEDCYAAIKVANDLGKKFKQNPQPFTNCCGKCTHQ